MRYFVSALRTACLNPYARVCVYTGAGNAMYYRSTTAFVFALNNYSGIVLSADTYASRVTRETDIRHALKQTRYTRGACGGTTTRACTHTAADKRAHVCTRARIRNT